MKTSPVTLMVFISYFVVLIGISVYAYYKTSIPALFITGA